MDLFLGVTDTDWFRYLRDLRPPAEDINFWQPRGGRGFRALQVGEPFLFKLKAPYNAIGGVGFYAWHTHLPITIA